MHLFGWFIGLPVVMTFGKYTLEAHLGALMLWAAVSVSLREDLRKLVLEMNND